MSNFVLHHLFATTVKAVRYTYCRGKLMTLSLPTGPDRIYLRVAPSLSVLTFVYFLKCILLVFNTNYRVRVRVFFIVSSLKSMKM